MANRNLSCLGFEDGIMHKIFGKTGTRQPTQMDLGDIAGVYSIQGARHHMEDAYQAVVDIKGDSSCGFYGVFDGHGGHRASDFTAESLHKLILKEKYDSEPVQSLQNAFRDLDYEWLTLASRNSYDDGSTAISVLIVNRTVYVANVGDSRGVLSHSGKAVDMSNDHKPTRDDEKKRIQDLGGRVIFYGTWRVEGVLAVSRAIGDRRLKKYVSAVPEIMERRLTHEDEYLILATDGVWDVLSSQDAVDVVASCNGNMKEAARKLTESAYKRGSMDNITSMVIDLRQYR